MEFKKPKKEDMIVIYITIAIVFVMMVSSATSVSEETGERLKLAELLGLNSFIIATAVISDYFIIKNREQKREHIVKTKEMSEKALSIMINIKSGGIGYNGYCLMSQLFINNLFFFGKDERILYEMTDYEWDGAKYKKIIQSQSEGKETGKKHGSGFASAGYGIGGALGNSNSVLRNTSNMETIERQEEEMGTAIIRMKRVSDERIISFVIDCNSEIDKQIRCFNNVPYHN